MNIEWNVIDDEWYVMNIEWHGYVYVPERSQPPKNSMPYFRWQAATTENSHIELPSGGGRKN